MKVKIFIFGITIFSTILMEKSGCDLIAQTPWFENTRSNQSLIPFRSLFIHSTSTMPTESPDSVHFTFYAKVANDLLQFVLKETLYEAQYELTIAINNDEEETVAGRIKRRKISVDNYKLTNDRHRFTYEMLDFYLSPGEYTLLIELLDIETKQPLRQKEKILLPDFFAQPMTTTDLLFFHERDVDPIGHTPHGFPNIPAVFSPSDRPFLASFTICSDQSSRELSIKQIILDSNSQPVSEDTITVTPRSRIQPVDISIDQQLRFGQYKLILEMIDGNTETTIESSFYIRWKTHSTHMTNLDQAIETVRYVMDGNLWKHLQTQPTEEQKKLLEKFWKERDPNPDTEENELEEEYYRRVSFTNQNFAPWGGQLDGWETDRGRIYIIFGPPSDVDNPSTPTGESSAYEIWYYRNLQKRFVFLDKYGEGDYLLITEE